MRQNILIVLLSVCATLLALNLVVSLRTPDLPVALGQAGVSGPYLLETGVTQSGNEAIICIFDTESKRLATYFNRGRGIELRGVRNIMWDLKLEDFDPKNRVYSVEEIAKAYKEQEKAGAPK